MNILYDKHGAPLSIEGWAMRFTRRGYKRIGLTRLPSGRTVSTVWLGNDHGFGEGAPVIFETMVFPGEELWRYTRLAAARAGHRRVVRALRKQPYKRSSARRKARSRWA